MSSLKQAVADYLGVRRKFGYKLREAGWKLEEFVAFLEHEQASHITRDLALRWAMQPANAHPAHWATRLRAVRLFAEYYRAIDPATEVPARDQLPYRRTRPQPYIYNDDEIRRLIDEAGKLSSPTGLRPHTHATLLGLLAATGLRIGEALALDLDDVDLEGEVLVIRQAKFGKKRLVPVHTTTRDALRDYALHRCRVFPAPRSPSLFLTEVGTRMEISIAYRAFVEVSRRIGLRGPTDSHGPRIHDLRHTFAVRTLMNWYRDGLDVDALLPRLSTYLGHVHVADTYWYLSAVPELMRFAAARLDESESSSR